MYCIVRVMSYKYCTDCVSQRRVCGERAGQRRSLLPVALHSNGTAALGSLARSRRRVAACHHVPGTRTVPNPLCPPAQAAALHTESERQAAAIRDLTDKLRRAQDAPRVDKAKVCACGWLAVVRAPGGAVLWPVGGQPKGTNLVMAKGARLVRAAESSGWNYP